MKKTYVAPLATEVSVATDNVVCMTSMTMDSNTTVNTQGGQLGNTHRGEWGNLWSKK